MQTLLDQLSSGKVVAVVGDLIMVMFLFFAGFNLPAAAIPDRYRWLYDATSQRCSLSILVSLVSGNFLEDPVHDEIMRGTLTCDRNVRFIPYGFHRRQCITRQSSTTWTTPPTSSQRCVNRLLLRLSLLEVSPVLRVTIWMESPADTCICWSVVPV
uniref:Uncharacterized protein n=1 Tax=Peronospora matthiolae TaxID=2874970 RepID=A0AAV1UQP0_9STRA